jgi:hypothetical protein
LQSRTLLNLEGSLLVPVIQLGLDADDGGGLIILFKEPAGRPCTAVTIHGSRTIAWGSGGGISARR